MSQSIPLQPCHQEMVQDQVDDDDEEYMNNKQTKKEPWSLLEEVGGGEGSGG